MLGGQIVERTNLLLRDGLTIELKIPDEGVSAEILIGVLHERGEVAGSGFVVDVIELGLEMNVGRSGNEFVGAVMLFPEGDNRVTEKRVAIEDEGALVLRENEGEERQNWRMKIVIFGVVFLLLFRFEDVGEVVLVGK